VIVLLGGLLVGAGLLIAFVGRERANRRRVRDLRAVLELQALLPADHDAAERTSSLLARSGVVAERALGEASVLSRCAHVLDRSDWTLSPGEFAVVSGVTAAIGGVIGIAVLGAVGGLLAGWVIVVFGLGVW
jgi:hypothetical protein